MSPRVLTPDEWLAEIRKAPAEPVSDLRLSPDDLLIVCAGFEDRALASLQNAVRSSSGFRVLVIHYLPHVEENRAADIRRLCVAGAAVVEDAVYDRERPAGFGSTVVAASLRCRGRVFLDVSAMSRLLIVQALVALGGRPAGFANCFVLYSEASQYPPTEREAEAKIVEAAANPTFAVWFLSTGVFDVTVVPELASIAPPGTQTRLIAYPSLDAQQLMAIRAEIHPSRFTLIEGVPPTAANAWRRSAISRLNQLDDIQNADRVDASTLDYAANLELLLTLYANRDDRERILLSPTGSKMQTVAVGIFRTFVRDVQIVYPTPETFLLRSQYTIGVGQSHLIELSAFLRDGGGESSR